MTAQFVMVLYERALVVCDLPAGGEEGKAELLGLGTSYVTTQKGEEVAGLRVEETATVPREDDRLAEIFEHEAPLCQEEGVFEGAIEDPFGRRRR